MFFLSSLIFSSSHCRGLSVHLPFIIAAGTFQLIPLTVFVYVCVCVCVCVCQLGQGQHAACRHYASALKRCRQQPHHTCRLANMANKELIFYVHISCINIHLDLHPQYFYDDDDFYDIEACTIAHSEESLS